MKSIQPSSLIYSYVMNNYWHTNYKADQEGPVTLAYSVLPHAAFNVSDAAKFGMERRQPLIIAAADASTSPPHPFLRLSSPDVLVCSLKPSTGGSSWLVYLYNPTEKVQKVSFRSDGGVSMLIRSSDAGG